MWNDVEVMQEAFEKTHPYNLHHDFAGFCMCQTQVLRTSDNVRLAPPRFAEIHVALDHIGGGYVAHEIQHAINYYVKFMDWDRETNDEDIASLAGDLTAAFWNGFYDNFRKEEK
jgi:hypothetical protein